MDGYTCIGLAYFAVQDEDKQDTKLYSALTISQSPGFSRDSTHFYTLANICGLRFGSKIKQRYYFTRAHTYRGIEQEGGKFIGIIHIGYTEQPHALLSDALFGSYAAGPTPKSKIDNQPGIWNTDRWVETALCYLIQRDTFVPCNDLKLQSPAAVFKRLQRQKEYVLDNWEKLCLRWSISIFEIGMELDEVVSSGSSEIDFDRMEL